MKTRHASRWSLRSLMGVAAAAVALSPLAAWAAPFNLRLYLDTAELSRGYVAQPVHVPPSPSGWTSIVDYVTLTAVPSNGWTFANWEKLAGSGDVNFTDGNSNSPTCAIEWLAGSTNIMLKAHFKASDVQLTIVSTNNIGNEIGDPQPPLSGRVFPYGTSLDGVSVTSPVNISSTERWRCLGFTSAGSIVPASRVGLTTVPVFAITNNTTVNWQWTADYGITTTNIGKGSIQLSDFGPWYTNGQVVVLTAVPDADFYFAGWSGSTNAATNVIAVTMTSAKNLRATFAQRFWPLTVVSPANTAGAMFSPARGTTNCLDGAFITASVSPTNAIGGGTNAICIGFSGLGSVPANGATPSVTFQMATNSQITWLWQYEPASVRLTVVSSIPGYASVGSPQPVTTNVPYNSQLQASVTSPTDLSGNQRIIASGFAGTGSAPSGGGPITTPFTMTQNSTLTWSWQTEYLLTVEIDPADGGGVGRSPGGAVKTTQSWWYPAGQTVNLQATPLGDNYFLAWMGDIGGFLPTNSVVMNGPRNVKAIFGKALLDQDRDGMPDDWENRFGLSPYDATGVNGAYGDPDQDGVANIVEYMISHAYVTNASIEASPIDCDSDGDGMDDGYEYYHITNIVVRTGGGGAAEDQGGNARAVVYTTGNNGREGNPDGDFLWNTLTGYRTKTALRNIDEYIGPDSIRPSLDDSPSSLFKANVSVAGITKLVRQLQPNPADSGDTSYSDTTDTDLDDFDDGYEYSWDQWQGVHAGDDVRDPMGHHVPFRFGSAALPSSAASGFWNADTNRDIVVANFNRNEVAVLYNQGGGLFALSNSVAVGSNPRALACGDLNGDGRTNDLVVANGGGATVSVLMGSTNGGFLAAVSYAVGVNPSYVAVGRLNGDAAPDIAVANEGDSTVTVLTNDGTGVFTAVGAYAVGPSPVGLALGSMYAHITNNAPRDIVTANRGGGVSLLQNNGNGSMAAAVPIVVAVSQPSAIEARDFNRDGTNDFVVCGYADNLVRVYVNNGMGGFGVRGTVDMGVDHGPRHLAAGDFNRAISPSGDPDVAVANSLANTVAIEEGTSLGELSQQTSLDVGQKPVWIHVADLTGDGNDDLVVVEQNSDSVSVQRGNGDSTFVTLGRYDVATTVTDRRYNPAVQHVLPPDGGRPDFDLAYDPINAGVGDWLSDDIEYSVGSSNYVGDLVLLRREYPDLPRCSHPFLWDADRDGMPDGWEMAFGYDPWNADTDYNGINDGSENPDGDWYAQATVAVITNGVTNNVTLRNNEVMKYFEYDPRTGYYYVPPVDLNELGPNTVEYINREEIRGANTRPAIVPNDPYDGATHPAAHDIDADGIWDGWELYVGLNPRTAADSGVDLERDGLGNYDEFFSFRTSTNIMAARFFVPGWQNKTHPTDPRNADTDDDQIGDGGERAQFNYTGGLGSPVSMIDSNTSEILYVHYLGGGLNPTTVDTDGDYLPDFWEASYASSGIDTNGTTIPDGMNGTTADYLQDYDGDGLLNYQEYMVGAVYEWQYRYNNGVGAYVPGLGIYNYNPYDFFNWSMSTSGARPNGGDAMSGPGGRRPKTWDPHFWAYRDPFRQVPYSFITAAEPPMRPHYFSSCDPRAKDSDDDGMDDFWTIYHGMNPILNGPIIATRDLVFEKVTGIRPNYPLVPPGFPQSTGWMEIDWDQDGLPNIYESAQQNAPAPYFYHTDPSPYWYNDASSVDSLANLYFDPGFQFGTLGYWFWDPLVLRFNIPPLVAPAYMFSFEMNEGFDTDNDQFGDRAELVDTPASPGSTDPLEPGDPIRHRALYLDGQSAAARTFYGDTHGWWQFRSFTVEGWVRPLNPATGVEQVIVERTSFLANGNPLGYPSRIRVNFRLGLDDAGRPFIGYHGSGFDALFEEAKAPVAQALVSGHWYHLAGVYDGAAKRLILYINGQMAAMTPTAEIPWNGWFGGNPINNPITPTLAILTMPILIGARENNPNAWVDGVPIYTGGGAGLWAGLNLFRQDPALDHFFGGHVDEIRIWDSARSQPDIANNRMKRFSRQDVARVNGSSQQLLVYAFGFDDLPDPDRSGVAPVGFNLLTGYPAAYNAIPWWAFAPDRSQVYDEYRYVPWIKNLASHMPLDPPRDTTLAASSNGVALYPNTSNPYTFEYVTATLMLDELHPFYTPSQQSQNLGQRLFGDLLPLRWAAADEEVELWDGLTPAAELYDEDGDGMPDFWETANGLDPRSAAGIDGATGDPDNDGLSNFYEYLCGTDPWSGDSNGNAIPDLDEDADGDGLSNAEELRLLTLPNAMDTDDDGLTDWEEVKGAVDWNYDTARPETSPRPKTFSDPLDPLSPAIQRSMYFNGQSRLIVPPSDKLMSKDWTVEAWINPAAGSDGGIVVSRYVGGAVPGQSGINYEIGLTTNAAAGTLRPYARYGLTTTNVEVETRVDGTCSNEHPNAEVPLLVTTGVWTHVAGVYESASNTLALYINGKLATYRTDAGNVPPTVFGYNASHWNDEVTIGAARSLGAIMKGYEGLIDEVRIWSGVRSGTEIADRYNAPEPLASDTNGTLRLKNRIVDTSAGLAQSLAATPAAGSFRLLVRFDSAASARDKAALAAQGVTVLGYVDAKTRVIGATRQQISSLGDRVRWCGPLQASDKISAKLGVDGSHAGRNVLVRFFNDVGYPAAVQAVQAAGGSAYGNAYLGGTYLVASLSDAQATALAGNDAVAWLAPAADFLTSGRAIRYLPGRLVDGVEAAPFAVLGNGWDGPGRGSADLTYFFLNNTTSGMDPGAARQGVVDQLDKWSAVAAITFRAGTQAGQTYALDIAWYKGAHGDGADFDGPGGVLGHGFYPNDINPEPIAGDFHLDDDENWQIGPGGNGIDLEYVALHEMGHCLGLDHSDDPTAVMYPFYDGTQNAQLKQDDIDGIQSIYGEPAVPGGPKAALNVTYFRFDDGGLTAQDFSVSNDWLRAWAHAARLDGTTANAPKFHTNSVPVLGRDTDGDGMPDWWEMAHGLDPYSGVGAAGGYGDVDGDGLANLYEFLAGTNPTDSDTDDDGFGDYDSRRGPGDRTWGERYDDGDGIADLWEIQYRGPCPATGKRGLDPAYYDANLDPDEDGWSNYAEFMSGTDPLDPAVYPTPSVALHVRYYGRLGNSLAEAIDPNSGAAANAAVKVAFYHAAAMDGYPDATLDMTTEEQRVRAFTTGHIHEGNNYLFAYLDVDSNSEWDPALEPAGIGQFQPVNLGWGDINNVEIGLTDKMPGYPRFAWPAVAGATTYAITNANVAGPAFSRVVKGPRTYLHEGDYLYAGLYGMGSGSKTFQVRPDDSPVVITSIVVSIPAVTLATPTVATPHGATYVYARNELEFTMDANATWYRLNIGAESGVPIVTTNGIVPYRDSDGRCKLALPVFAGDSYAPSGTTYASSVWTNGPYWVSVQGLTLNASSATSAWSNINFDLRSPDQGGKSMIAGDVYYFGKVRKGYGEGDTSNKLTIIVQAYESAGFSGVAEGQYQISYTCNTNSISWTTNLITTNIVAGLTNVVTNSFVGANIDSNTNNVGTPMKGAYRLMGLGNKTYHVRAFIDMNNNRRLDAFEPLGFAKARGDDYRPMDIDLSGAGGVAASGVRVVIRDRDTDDDQLADGWEWMYYGTLGKGPYDTGVTNQTYWGSTNMTLLRCYEVDPFDVDPTAANGDTDGDGVSDFDEVCYNNRVAGTAPDVSHYDPYDPVANPRGTDLNPMKWDTDGDGLSDGYELAHGLNPIDPDGDADGDGIRDVDEILVTRTSPLVAAETLRVTKVAVVTPGTGLVSVKWAGRAGATYQVQYSDNLRTWQDCTNGLRAGEGEQVYVDEAPATVKFYRVMAK